VFRLDDAGSFSVRTTKFPLYSSRDLSMFGQVEINSILLLLALFELIKCYFYVGL
jgi:hypothetical protein